MTQVPRSPSDLAARDARVVELAREGKTFPEICDIMGLDQTNAAKWRTMIKEAGVTLGPARPWSAKGTDGWPPRFRGRTKELIHKLRDKHSQPVVSEMLGLSNKELKIALGDDDYKRKHNWTIGQLQRLAEAHGMTVEQLMCDVLALKPDPERKPYGFA